MTRATQHNTWSGVWLKKEAEREEESGEQGLGRSLEGEGGNDDGEDGDDNPSPRTYT